MRSVEGRLADDRGAPVRDLTVTVCGLVCFAALSDTGCNFSVPVDAFLPEGGYAVTANGRPTFGGIYTGLPAGAEGTVRLAEPVVLPRFENLNMLNVVVAGHIPSDPLGMNLFLDELEKQGIEVIPAGGLIRVSRVKKVNKVKKPAKRR